VALRASTKALMAKRGRRIERPVHNGVYHAFSHPYVCVACHTLRFPERDFTRFTPCCPTCHVRKIAPKAVPALRPDSTPVRGNAAVIPPGWIMLRPGGEK